MWSTSGVSIVICSINRYNSNLLKHHVIFTSCFTCHSYFSSSNRMQYLSPGQMYSLVRVLSQITLHSRILNNNSFYFINFIKIKRFSFFFSIIKLVGNASAINVTISQFFIFFHQILFIFVYIFNLLDTITERMSE